MTGVWVLIGVLLAASAFGVWFGRTSGRIKDTAATTAAPAMEGIVAASPDDPPVDVLPAGEESSALAIALADRLGPRVTVVQFSSAFCRPCRATRRILEEVATMIPGVAHVEIDSEDNLDLVRAMSVRRTPTVLFLDARGTVRKRASGLPRKADVIAAIGELIPPEI